MIRKLTSSLCTILMIFVALATFASGCTSTKLADSFDSAAVETSAHKVIENLNAKDYDAIKISFKAEYQDQMTPEVLSNAVTKTYQDAAFTKIESTTIVGQNKDGADRAVAIVQTRYGEKKVIFTIIYNTEMELIGFFMK